MKNNAETRYRCQVSVYRTIGPLVFLFNYRSFRDTALFYFLTCKICIVMQRQWTRDLQCVGVWMSLYAEPGFCLPPPYSCGRGGQDRSSEIKGIFSLKTPCDWRFHCFCVTMHGEVGSERTSNKIVITLYLTGSF